MERIQLRGSPGHGEAHRALERGGARGMEAGANVVYYYYTVSYRYDNGVRCASSKQWVYPTQTYTEFAEVHPGCPVNAKALFIATAAVAWNLRSKNLKLQDQAQFPQCSETTDGGVPGGVFQSPAYIIMYGTTFYEYKAAKLFRRMGKRLGTVKVESNRIGEINRLKEKWKKSTTRRTTTLVKPAPELASTSLMTSVNPNTEAFKLKEMCVRKHGPHAVHAEGCDLIYDADTRTSANVYQVHRCPAGPTARAQLLLMRCAAVADGEGATRADLPRGRRGAPAYVGAERPRDGLVALDPLQSGVPGDEYYLPESRAATPRRERAARCDRAAAVTVRMLPAEKPHRNIAIRGRGAQNALPGGGRGEARNGEDDIETMMQSQQYCI